MEISRRLSILQPFNLWQRAGEDKQRDGGCVQERLWFLPDGLIVLMSTFDGIVAGRLLHCLQRESQANWW